jgi:hypothetical protein
MRIGRSTRVWPGFLACAVAFLGVSLFAATGWVSWSNQWNSSPHVYQRWVNVDRGGLFIIDISWDYVFSSVFDPEEQPPPPGFSCANEYGWCWSYERAPLPTGRYLRRRLMAVPLWPLVLLMIAPATIGLARRVLARSGDQGDRCAACGYDRLGLVLGAKCPECGTAPS